MALDHPAYEAYLPEFGMTMKEFLVNLLLKVWDEEEGFNGKRPFGNSSWQHDVAYGLVKSGIIEGYIDPDGYLEGYDHVKFEKLMQELIKGLL